MRRILLVCLFVGLCLVFAGTVGWLPALALAQKPVTPPALSPKNFDIRLIRVDNTYQGIKFNTVTGESWQIGPNGWEKLAETVKKLDVGDFDMFLLATDEDYTAIRFDYRTGTTWELKEKKWVRVPDAEPRR